MGKNKALKIHSFELRENLSNRATFCALWTAIVAN